MSKRKEELTRAIDSHITQGKAWQAVGDGHKTLAAMGGDAADVHKGMADACDKAVVDHASQATFCMSSLKAMDDADLNKIRPDNISSVQSIDTPTFGFRAIPRAGAPSVDAAVDKANIPLQFRHLIAMDPEDI
jgi:hypothetical protein